jgi:hypothetical protein
MKKEYNLKIEDDSGIWQVTFESKTKGSLIKGALIRELWGSEPLTVYTLMDRLRESGSKLSNTISHQRLTNIIRGCKLFEIVGDTEEYYGSAIDSTRRDMPYKVYIYKLNKDYLKGWGLLDVNIQGCK